MGLGGIIVLSLLFVEWFNSSFVCMGSLYHCIVACTHLGNSTCPRTVTMVAPLLLNSGLGRYEAVLHSCGTSPVGQGGGY